jgi:two-component system cell cycle sensor histidine kinase/response regulator CckA
MLWLQSGNTPKQSKLSGMNSMTIESPVTPTLVQTDIDMTRPHTGGSSARTTILFVDDEPALRSLGRVILERYGYRVLEAEDGVKALEVLHQQRGQIDLVILDLCMPRLSGEATFRVLQETDQRIPVLFASGDFLDQQPPDKHNQIAGFVFKPYRPRELAALVQTAFERCRQVRED